MTVRARMSTADDYTPTHDASGAAGRRDDRRQELRDDERGDRRSPTRPQGDSRFPAHIMAAVRGTIRAAAATCVEPSRLEASGPYEWLAIVEAHDKDLYQMLRLYIESCRYLDDLEHRGDDLGMGRVRLAEAIRSATFAKESMRSSLLEEIARRPGGGVADL
jgi:hypothetical protein